MAADIEVPRVALAHHEIYINFRELPPDHEFYVNVIGGPGEPYFAELKTDRFGEAQLIWRTPAPGKYTVKLKGEDVSGSKSFEVHGPEYEERFGTTISVEEPGKMGDTSSREVKEKANTPREDLNEAQDDPQYQPHPPISERDDMPDNLREANPAQAQADAAAESKPNKRSSKRKGK